jgi:hypothetical protein
LPDFSWHIKPKWENLTTKYTKSPVNTSNGLKIPTGHKIYRNIPFPVLQKYSQIGIFGLKIYHLATLMYTFKSASSPFPHQLILSSAA